MIKEQLPNATADFDAAIRYDAGFADAYHNRGLAYQKQGDTARTRPTSPRPSGSSRPRPSARS